MDVKLSPHATSLFPCILQKIHVHRMLELNQIDVTVANLYASYSLPKDTHLHINHSDVHTMSYLLCLKGYTVTLLHDADISSDASNDMPFCSIQCVPPETEKEHTEVGNKTVYPALRAIERRHYVPIPTNGI